MKPVSADPHPTRTYPIAIAALGLFICTGGPSTFATLHVFHLTPSTFIWTNLYPFVALACAGVILLAQHLRTTPIRRLVLPLGAVTGYVGWALISVLWSASPTITPVAALTGIGIAAFGCWFGLALGGEEQITAVLLATATAVLASIAVIEIRPHDGLEPVIGPTTGGEWMGIFGNRNSLAAISTLGIVAAVGFVAVHPTVRRAAIAAPLALAELIALWKTHGDTSRISLLVCAGTAVLVPAIWSLRRLRVPGLAVAGVGVTSVGLGWVMLFDHLESLGTRFGFDPTLSSRRTIWKHVRDIIRVHPFRGYGFWGFWDNLTLTAYTYGYIGKPYASAHNAVLEVLVMLGAIGLFFYLVIVANAFGSIFRWTWFRRGPISWWWAVLLAYLAVENLTESFVLWHSYNWVLVIAASCVGFAQPPLRQERASGQFPPTPEADATVKDSIVGMQAKVDGATPD